MPNTTPVKAIDIRTGDCIVLNLIEYQVMFATLLRGTIIQLKVKATGLNRRRSSEVTIEVNKHATIDRKN